MRSEYGVLRVGLVGLGLQAYWAQFAGLESRLTGYVADVQRKITAPERLVVNLGLIDTPEKSVEASHRARHEDIDILLVYVTTYTLSATVLPLIKRAGVPVILLNLQPTAALDYERFNAIADRAAMTGEWLAYCNSCPVPEIVNVLRRLNIAFHQVTGMLHDDLPCWIEIEQWLRAAGAVKRLAHARLGLMGHYYSGMLDISTDLVQVSGRFGTHVEMLEVDELTAIRTEVSHVETAEKIAAFQTFFEIDEECPRAELERAAITAAALNRLIQQRDLDLLAYYYMGSGMLENENTISSIIPGASMLTAAGVPVAGEYEVKNVLAMKIMDLLGRGGSFTEYYGVDFAEDFVIMGHDGPGHLGIAEGSIRLRSLGVFHGKVGAGLSVEMSVKHGPVTLLSVVEDRETGFMLLVAQGECVPGPVLEIGNTNSCYRFSLGARGFINNWNSQGPAHHCAIGTGHCATELAKVASLLRLRFVQVC